MYERVRQYDEHQAGKKAIEVDLRGQHRYYVEQHTLQGKTRMLAGVRTYSLKGRQLINSDCIVPDFRVTM